MPLLLFGIAPSRLLTFNIRAIHSEIELIGEMRLFNWIRIPVAIYLAACVLAEVIEIVRLSMPGNHETWVALLGPALGFAMIYGWTLWILVMNRRNDSLLIKAVEHAMKSEYAAKIVSDLLSSPR